MDVLPNQYCISLTEYKRFPTREVMIGAVGVGGNNPIRLQSMTTTDTMDIIGTVEQTIRIYEAGADIVRITAPSKREAQALQEIKNELQKRGYDIPLVADIHFTPNAALIAAQYVEKVRINPGNYADKKKFEVHTYTDSEYEEELERIQNRFLPLIKVCKEEGRAMRIGTNHGSLSDRIMSRYGDTPIGMVESALEFARICEAENYNELVFSMKSSNPKVMVQAYRLLVNQMMEQGMNYPIHLGVTEAGDGEDGRIKSAVGIGALLEDGIGDTVRVSLTEAPEAEIPVAAMLAKRYETREKHPEIFPIETLPYSPFQYHRKETKQVQNIGANEVPVVVIDTGQRIVTNDLLHEIGYEYDAKLDKYHITDTAADYVIIRSIEIPKQLPQALKIIQPYQTWAKDLNTLPLLNWQEYVITNLPEDQVKFVFLTIEDFMTADVSLLQNDQNAVIVLSTDNHHAMPEIRRTIVELMEQKIANPIIASFSYSGENWDEIQLHAATDFGSLLCDGLIDGLYIADANKVKEANTLCFGVLQNTRRRISKTEYISCPSCGRTLFDLEETTAKIRSRTNHLKGLKIGIMGCIVNGPGEMADADYGYVGSGVGKITLYKGQEVQKKNIPEVNAVDELIDLIKEYGDWV